MDFPDPRTVAGVFEKLTLQWPEVEFLRSSLLIAVNYEYANWDTSLKEGDEVAFFPPVSGGCF
jgi:molybdopterin converting factor small subunit